MENNYELYHYGVKGMRWGVRRFQNKDGSRTAAGKKRRHDEDTHDDYKRVHDTKSVKSMSDKELRERLNRLNMEKQYKQLSSENTNRGKKCVDKILKSATTVATVTSTALTIYNNADKIKKIVDGLMKRSE